MTYRAFVKLGLVIAASALAAVDGGGARLEGRAVARLLPPSAEIVPRHAYVSRTGLRYHDGGYGAAIAADPNRAGYFYLLRSVDSPVVRAGETAPLPIPAPSIGLFHLDGTQLAHVADVTLRHSDASEFTGIPNHGTERLTRDGAAIVDLVDPSAIAAKGLVVMRDRTFWVSDWLGPSLRHFDRTGRQVEHIGTRTGTKRLPRVLAKRRLDRGLAGLTLAPDGITLLAIMQSPLDNPRQAGRASRLTRIVSYDTRSGTTMEFLYPLDDPSMQASDIVAVSSTDLLVLEGDEAYPGDSTRPSRGKRVYRVDVSRATDVRDQDDAVHGRRIAGKTIEALSDAEVRAAGIAVARKTLLVNLLALGYPHDKPEGLAIVDDSTIAISNDDDHGIAFRDARLITKILPRTGAIDQGRVYFVTLPSPLR